MELMTCRNLAISAEVMQHIVNVESGSNPYAIGVVGGQLVRQPQNLGEALATVHMLDAKGYNYSLGVAQVNRANLGKYGLDSYEKAFDACSNLAAGSRILAACYARSNGDWGKSFSCYYSGNFVTGYREGYVQKVYDSINRSAKVSDGVPAQAIPLKASLATPRGSNKVAITPTDSSAYRVAIRSVILDTAITAVTPAVAATLVRGRSGAMPTSPNPSPPALAAAATTTVNSIITAPSAAATPVATTADIFVPHVRGPNDPFPVSAPASTSSPTQIAAIPTPSKSAADTADLRLENRDAAFTF
jgi:type IV secretion system protein VirB1